MDVNYRIASLRNKMQQEGISSCVITNSDPHMSEYIADHWKEREWISGFDGSNGVIVLTVNSMALWTDSRYTLQAENQLKGTGCGIFITTNPLPEIAAWLRHELPQGNHRVNIGFNVFPVTAIRAIKQLAGGRFSFVYTDLITPLWKKRPAFPLHKAYLLDDKYSGESASSKINTVQRFLRQVKTDALLLTMLDDIAWLFNIRGNDIDYNPLTMAYAVIEPEKSILFIYPEKLTDEVRHQLQSAGIIMDDYNAVESYLSSFAADKTIWLDASKTNQYLYDKLPQNVSVQDKPSPVSLLKSIKNTTEINGIKNACVKDGVAMVKFCVWLGENVNKGVISEISVAEKLKAFRQQQDLFVGESFATIAGYKENGAIVHYNATDYSNKILKNEGFLLIDSGAQYFDGTTDITRTFALGNPGTQEKTDYTLVLKGHIALARAIFPHGTYGYQLDVLARQFLWQHNLNYGHGTGHGIGHFLNVHEGPQSIRPDTNTTILEAGMLISNEPGVYRTNKYGIRLENMILATNAGKSEFGDFMCFETLTLFPFDVKAIDFSLLTHDETQWLRNYHQHVIDMLSPHLNREEQEWLHKSKL